MGYFDQNGIWHNDAVWTPYVAPTVGQINYQISIADLWMKLLQLEEKMDKMAKQLREVQEKLDKK